MDARKVAEQAINDLFDMSEREGRCISKDAATDLLERHIRAGMEIQPGFNADGTIYTLTKDQLPRHVANGVTHAMPARVIQVGATSAQGLVAGTQVHRGGYVWNVAADGLCDLRSWPQPNDGSSGSLS